MLTLFDYMMRISACYAAAYLFYWLVLRRLTNYKSNRFYLLITALFAFILPLLRLDLFVSPQTVSQSNFINRIPSLHIDAATNAYIPGEHFDMPFMLVSLFIGGIIVCLSYFMMQLVSFKKITARASLISIEQDIWLYHLDMDIMPFSFGKAVYVNRHKHTPAELDDIIKHEAVHASQHHTIDVMIAEFVCILNWYNPFVWLIKHAVKQNLEFLADDTVIKNGADKKNYQYLLLKVTGYSPLSIASSFKLSSLKQRIYMMNKTRTSQRHLLKLLFVLPLIAIMMLAFRDNDVHTVNTINYSGKEGQFMLTELSYNIPDANVDRIVKKAQDASLLQVGKPFTITTIKDERDRLKNLLEKNGYNNISSNAISFLIDSSLVNNSFSVQVNIDLQRKKLSFNNSNKQTNNITANDRSAYFHSITNDNRVAAADNVSKT